MDNSSSEEEETPLRRRKFPTKSRKEENKSPNE
jgi:hypothetical protein